MRWLFGKRKIKVDAHARFKAHAATQGWEIGDHSYGVPELIDAAPETKLKIGRFTSIAVGVKIVFQNHRTDLVTTYPFTALRHRWQSAAALCDDHVGKGDIVIGNDVWIGTDALITPGITIGNGAVIGAKSVVTKDVPAYAVVAGVPARLIRFRFSPALIADLEEVRWWDLPDAAIDELLPLIMSTDIEALIRAVRARRAEIDG
ncbi:CatB-related O-acetyltransferase [Acidocella sp. KAb 2-4]|uniref:CatB-related O-acetyltransferase n=1 Tax=Acidocella sp. KAb 2-4 TaxID=2885158 RepID=UPI001D060E30|nr:CatB-related O-acetyltransferase [Acidocella sp. KAb 2-4]MCB5944458.1 CatB-related O-acetyltransferase [Acidocella sp. KAb 2-4]